MPPTTVNSTDDLDVMNLEEIAEVTTDLTYKDVEVPEFGHNKKIRLQILSAGEAINFSKAMRDVSKKDDAIARIVMLCAINRDGTRMMKSDKALEILKGRSIVAVQRLQKEALILNGFIDEAGNTVDPKAAELAAKNA
jgi:hypothetical protein